MARLTHFLCLPLVNATSMQQLETSLATFKAAHQSVLGSSKSHDGPNSSGLGLPEKAFRPLGTLHLTLGVMSLSKEQLAQATSLLQSLDLTGLMREAERVATQSQDEGGRRQASHSSTSQLSTPDRPLTMSLESLHAMPQADAATISHASPVDPTGRLYPFCVMLRDKFIEAGFMKPEFNKQKKKYDSRTGSNLQPSQTLPRPIAASGDSAKNPDPYIAAITRTPNQRPLLLHATLANTRYARERSRSLITFDASKLVSKPPLAASALASSPVPGNSYIWATEFPLDAICICEMGAKRLDPNADTAHPLSERLGAQYQVVAQRNLRPSTPKQ